MGTIKFTREDDYDADLSFYGEFTNSPQPFCIDRKTGNLYGKAVEEPEYPGDREEDEQHTMAEWDVINADYDNAYQQWENDHGLELLEENAVRTMGRNEYRYFVPYEYDPESEKPELIVWLHDRMVGHGIEWGMQGFIVEVVDDKGNEISEDSLWSIESDAGEVHHLEILAELLPFELPQEVLVDLLEEGEVDWPLVVEVPADVKELLKLSMLV